MLYLLHGMNVGYIIKCYYYVIVCCLLQDLEEMEYNLVSILELAALYQVGLSHFSSINHNKDCVSIVCLVLYMSVHILYSIDGPISETLG